MAEINLTQAEADALIAMEKHRANEERCGFPMGGQSVVLPLQSPDRREQFLLDLRRGRIDLLKVTMQKRGRQVVVLVRLDLGDRRGVVGAVAVAVEGHRALIADHSARGRAHISCRESSTRRYREYRAPRRHRGYQECD